MDALAGFLDGPRARSAFLLRSVFRPPWCLRIEDGAPLTVIAIVSGRPWLISDDGTTAQLAAGDIAIVRGPTPYAVTHDPHCEPTVIIQPGQVCSTPQGEPLFDRYGLGVRTWGNDLAGGDVLLTGTYEREGEISRTMLDALPGIIVVHNDEWSTPLIGLLAEEIRNDPPGQQAVLDRLLDLLVIAVLRHWCTRPDAEPPRWYRAQADPLVGHALRVIHDDPAHPWTVGGLATEVGLSRAAFAKRFTAVVGEAPMTYLTGWRMSLAADILAETGTTVTQTAARVGYANPFTFSTAFKRHHGRGPREYRNEQVSSVAG